MLKVNSARLILFSLGNASRLGSVINSINVNTNDILYFTKSDNGL